jgi:hypothetical protein
MKTVLWFVCCGMTDGLYEVSRCVLCQIAFSVHLKLRWKRQRVSIGAFWVFTSCIVRYYWRIGRTVLVCVKVDAIWRRNDWAVTRLKPWISQCRIESYIECCLCCFSDWRMLSGKLLPKCRTWTQQTRGKEMALVTCCLHLMLMKTMWRDCLSSTAVTQRVFALCECSPGFARLSSW